MNDLQIFENKEFGEIRTVMVNEEALFCLADICRVLGIANATQVADRLEDDERSMLDIGRAGKANFVTESGLYAVILRSDKPNAKKFRKWVTSEVLPSIRKHGMYAVDELLENPDIAIKAFTALKEEKERNKRLEQEKKALEVETIEMDKKISELQPKANYVDIILQSKSTVTITQIAQDYGMTANKLNAILRDMGIQRKVKKQWILYSDYQGNGYVHSHTVDIVRKDGSPDVVMNTEWTQKGRLFLYEELKKKGIYPMIEKCA